MESDGIFLLPISHRFRQSDGGRINPQKRQLGIGLRKILPTHNLRDLLVLFSLILTSMPVLARNGATGNDTSDVPELKPAFHWTFDGRATSGTWVGKAAEGAPGPRPPSYPAFAPSNLAVAFSGDGRVQALEVKDQPELRFSLNDTVTLEAWVKVRKLTEGATPYLIGKGRNGAPGFCPKNQNYALRLKGEKGQALVGFLFSSTPASGHPGDWHRWWSKDGFPVSTGGWHHVAVSYTFGKSATIRGFVDGKEVSGGWDMGGASDHPPVTDGDCLVLGTGSTREGTHSLDGWLDEVSIYRGSVNAEMLKARFAFVPPPPVINRDLLKPGEILVQLCEEGVPEANAWPVDSPRATETYSEEVFGFVEIPQKYVDTGVRGDRAIPLLLRAAAWVTLPEGTHRLLVRGRGACRLCIDERIVLSTLFPKADSGGHGLVAEQSEYLNLGPDFRFASPGDREAWCETKGTGRPQLFVLETMVGSLTGKSKRRPELGETVVAWSPEGSQSWMLVSPGGRQVNYTDSGWTSYEKERREHFASWNAAARATMRDRQAGYWKGRREIARQWLGRTAEVPVPRLPAGFPANNPIDHFIAAKIAQISKQNDASHRGGADFFEAVQPILEKRCVECHRGSKAKGGLALDSLSSALKGGKSDGSAVTPGKPEESALIARITSGDEDERMPPKGEPLSEKEIQTLITWVREGATWPEIRSDHLMITPLSDDLTFLRRVTLDAVGVVPSLAEIEAFQKNPDRQAVIERLLQDRRWADHWMGYWQDVLAENPNILNPTLNNTGPFRWWIYESLQDNKPMDLLVTELLRMKGSERLGGPAGFAVASQNDVPMAAKGTIVSAAFLGVEMKCARCHDAPSHRSVQEDLFSLAAMLNGKELTVPVTSSVPNDRIHSGGRKPLIQVTLKPGSKVAPKWPFPEFCEESVTKLAQTPSETRDELAALITAPQNERFAQVISNRVWARLMGRGIVEPVEDWERGRPSHPELLSWLGREFVRGGYDLKHLTRLILSSHAYQRATDPVLRTSSPLFTSPAPRRLDAEQIVDSLFAGTGKPFRTEEFSLDIDNLRDLQNAISLGHPQRSWMFASTSNERDRPSLSLPRIQAVADLLSAFGWRGARQDPVSRRDTDPNVLQPAIVSNGTAGVWLTRLSDDHGITSLALQDQTLDKLLDQIFLKLLTRYPSEAERAHYHTYLDQGFEGRIRTLGSPAAPAERVRPKYVSWSNHLDSEATLVRQEQQDAARRGDPITERLEADWRARLEDVLWALLNSPEWVFSS